MTAYYLLKLLSKIFCLMPRPLAEITGKILGEFFWLVLPKKRKTLAVNNIIRCLKTDEETARRIAKKSATRFGPMTVEVMRFPIIKNRIDEYVTYVGTENLEAIDFTKKGAAFFTSHCGNWELLGGALAIYGLPLVAVGKKQKSDGPNKFITEYRALMGMHVTYNTDVREMFDLLKKGGIIGLLSDQDPDIKNGIVIDFFGRPTNCVTGAAAMSRFNGTPIIPAFIHRREDGIHEAMLYPPIYVRKTRDKQADIAEATREANKVLEDHIRKYPEDWFWIHDRWKSIREEYHLE